MKEVNREVLLGDADPEIHPTLEEWLDAGFTVVRFQNVTLDSSSLGQTTYLKVGEGCTYAHIDDVSGHHLYDLPSQRQYPQEYCLGLATLGR